MLAVICDDLAADRETLLEYCTRYAKENRLPIATLEFENAGALLNSREARSADVMFLDIYMDGALGVDAARILRGKGFRGALEEALGGDPFLRSYRYFIVNMDFVKRLNEDGFLMKDGREIPLSRDGRAALKSRYMAYVFRRMEG